MFGQTWTVQPAYIATDTECDYGRLFYSNILIMFLNVFMTYHIAFVTLMGLCSSWYDFCFEDFMAVISKEFHQLKKLQWVIFYINKCNRVCQILPLTHTMAKNVFHHQSIAVYINKITNCRSTTTTSWLVCFFWVLFLRPVRRPGVLRCSLNVTGWLVQAATLSLLKIITWLVHDVGYGFSYILWHFECNGASF